MKRPLIRPRVWIVVAITTAVIVLPPKIFNWLYPDEVLCVIPNGPEGEAIKASGAECDQPGAIRLEAK